MKRTTVRLKEGIYKKAKKHALNKDTTFQKVLNDALWSYLNTSKEKKTKKQSSLQNLPKHSLGAELEVMDRDVIYGTPEI